MLRIVSLNLNGIRSACRKGFADWIGAHRADVVCVQEVKAHATDLDDAMRALGPGTGHFPFAQQKGYSGVGLYARRKPKAVRAGRLRGRVCRGAPSLRTLGDVRLCDLHRR